MRKLLPVVVLVAFGSTGPTADGQRKIDRRAAAPGTGNITTTFTYTFRAIGPIESPDWASELQLFGPKTASRRECRGRLAAVDITDSSGTVTAHFKVARGKVDEARFNDSQDHLVEPGRRRDLRTWCRGYYTGKIVDFDQGTSQTVSRFFFMVR